jgi:SAM-dependent methyltransferase
VFQKQYAKAYNLLNSSKDYKSEIEFVYDWAAQPKRIFDVGCGTAFYWKYFPSDVVIYGIERSIEMIIQSGLAKYIRLGDAQNSINYKGMSFEFDLVTAIFDVINYIPSQRWWSSLPVKKGGYFIFDVLDKEKIDQEGFKRTLRKIGDIERQIFPGFYDGRTIDLRILLLGSNFMETEIHKLYVYSEKDIEKYAAKSFEIVEIKKTENWQTWWKLRRK